MVTLRIVTALAVFCALQVPSTGFADEFPAVVAEILQSQTEGRISEMGEEHKLAMIKCVNGVLTELPEGKKRYVLEGANLEEREHRFGEVVKENQAEWEQNIARGCSDVALSNSN